MKPHDRDETTLSRRDLMGRGLAGLGLAALGPLAGTARARTPAPSTTPTMLVVIELRGGNDGLNTVVPVTLGQYAARRPQVALTPGSCLPMNTGPYATNKYALNPVLTNLQALWASGELAIVNKVGYPQPNLSHFKSLDIWGHAVRGSFQPLGVPRSGWVARYADLHAPAPFGAVQIGHGRPVALMGGTTRRFMSSDLSRYQFVEDGHYPQNHQHRLNTVRKVLSSGSWNLPHRPGEAAQLAHDLAGQVVNAVGSYVSSVTYPSERFAHNLRDVATMIQAGFGTRIFYTGFEGFDHHANQGVLTGSHPTLLAALDAALAAFIQDLKNMGVWGQTVIAIVSDFGRRNYDNNSLGTDHGGGNCMMVCGGPVLGGMYGNDLTEADLGLEFLPNEIDFRSVYREIVGTHLGVSDLDPVFPEREPNPVVLGLL